MSLTHITVRGAREHNLKNLTVAIPRGPMTGLMQDWKLTVDKVIDHAFQNHGQREIVTRTVEGPIVRSTYADLYYRSRQVSNALLADGVQKGDRIGIAARNSTNWIVAYMAVLMAGGCACLLNGWWSGEEMAAGIDLTHVPYKGTSQILPDLLDARIDMALDSLPAYLPHLKSGRLRALANMAACLQDAGYFDRAIEVTRELAARTQGMTVVVGTVDRDREADGGKAGVEEFGVVAAATEAVAAWPMAVRGAFFSAPICSAASAGAARARQDKRMSVRMGAGMKFSRDFRAPLRAARSRRPD